MKVDILLDCSFTIDKSVFLPGTTGKYSGLSKSLLIQTKDEKILVDTGFGNIPSGPKFKEIRRANQLHRDPGQGLVKQLAKRRLKPTDITTVINTHLHAAHSGNNNLFPHARFFISKNEFNFIERYIGEDPNRYGYIPEFFDRMEDIDQVNGDDEIAEGVRIVQTPGHTLGHQSLVIDREEGKLIYSGDVSPLRVNLETRTAMSGYDRDLTVKSMKKLLDVKNAKWLFSHDSRQRSLRSAYSP